MAGRTLKDGEEVLLRGSGGALFRSKVGQPFTKDLIERRLKAGEWSWPDDEPAAKTGEPQPRTERKSKPSDRPGDDGPQPRTEYASDPGDRESGDGPQPRKEIVSDPDTRPDEAPGTDVDADPDRPAANAPKSEWVAYVARTQHMSREDAANYTKADLMDMAK